MRWKRSALFGAATIGAAAAIAGAWHVDAKRAEIAFLHEALDAAQTAQPPDTAAAECISALLSERETAASLTSREALWLHRHPSTALQQACARLQTEIAVRLGELLRNAFAGIPLPLP